MTEKEKKEFLFKHCLICVAGNCIKLMCFTLLAIVFKKWQLILFVILFWGYVDKKESD